MNSECKVTKIIDMNNTMVNKADKLSIKISVFIKIICFKQNYLVFLSPDWRTLLYRILSIFTNLTI